MPLDEDLVEEIKKGQAPAMLNVLNRAINAALLANVVAGTEAISRQAGLAVCAHVATILARRSEVHSELYKQLSEAGEEGMAASRALRAGECAEIAEIFLTMGEAIEKSDPKVIMVL